MTTIDKKRTDNTKFDTKIDPPAGSYLLGQSNESKNTDKGFLRTNSLRKLQKYKVIS